MTERITIWVTKYALTKGIQKHDDCRISDYTPKMAYRAGTNSMIYYHDNEWHRTEAEAIARAEEMRLAKVASLEKQIAKLLAMTFGEKGDD